MKITKKQKSFLDKVVNGVWSINSDTNLIDVEGSVDMSHMKLIEVMCLVISIAHLTNLLA
jgi:hypothetical protein